MRGSSVNRIALIMLLGLTAAGCASVPDKSSGSYSENRRFVPRIYVQNDSFGAIGSSDYRGCTYDMYYDGYWCPAD